MRSGTRARTRHCATRWVSWPGFIAWARHQMVRVCSFDRQMERLRKELHDKFEEWILMRDMQSEQGDRLRAHCAALHCVHTSSLSHCAAMPYSSC